MIVITNTTNGRSVLKADSSGNTGLEAYKRHFTTALISKQILTLSNVDCKESIFMDQYFFSFLFFNPIPLFSKTTADKHRAGHTPKS